MELDNLMNSIKENILDLQKKNYPKNVLVQNAFNRGMRIFKGDLSKQNIIDLCVIALTVLISEDSSKAL